MSCRMQNSSLWPCGGAQPSGQAPTPKGRGRSQPELGGASPPHFLQGWEWGGHAGLEGLASEGELKAVTLVTGPQSSPTDKSEDTRNI